MHNPKNKTDKSGEQLDRHKKKKPKQRVVREHNEVGFSPAHSDGANGAIKLGMNKNNMKTGSVLFPVCTDHIWAPIFH